MNDVSIEISNIFDKRSDPANFPRLKPGYDYGHYLKRVKVKKSPLSVTYHETIDELFGPRITLRIIKDKSPFVWDGSYLGRIRSIHILDQAVYSKIKYWLLSACGHRAICAVRSITSNVPCITDELKPYFSLSKVGTHTVTYGTKKYLLIKAHIDSENKIIEEITIDKVDPNRNEDFINRVQEVFVFRDLLGLNVTHEKSIVVRWSSITYIPPYPVSFYESDMRPYDDKPVVSLMVEDKWFQNRSFDEVMKSMLKLQPINSLLENNSSAEDPMKIKEVAERISYLRCSMEKTIERIDRNLIWVIQPIIDKLIRRLNGDATSGCTPSWDLDI